MPEPINVWTDSFETLAREMYNNYASGGERYTSVVGAVLQARVALEMAEANRQMTERLVTAAADTAAETRRLVAATLWVAGFTAFAALAAAAAALAAIVNALGQRSP